MSRSFAAAGAALLAAAGCANRAAEPRAAEAPSPVPAADAVVFITAGLRGSLAPCGCTANMRGGIARMAHELSSAREAGKPVLFFDAGDALFGDRDIPPARVAQEEVKARTVARALLRMGLTARAEGGLDRTRGAEFLASLGLPTLAEGEVRVVDAGRRKVGVVAASSAAELEEGARRARAQGASLVLGFYPHGIEEAQKVAALVPSLDVLVCSQPDLAPGDGGDRLVRAGAPVVQLAGKGQSLLRIDLAFGNGDARLELVQTRADVDRDLYAIDGRLEILKKQVSDPRLSGQARAMRQQKVEELVARRAALAATPAALPVGENAYALRFVPLEAALPELPEISALVSEANRDIATLNLAWARAHAPSCPAPEPGRAAFVGTERCRSCHPEAFSVWQASKHAEAYRALESGSRQFDLSCVSCHVTGMGQPGGVCRVDQVAGRDHVGCESCHGPGSLHAQAPAARNIAGAPAADACVGCHNPENSTHFDFETYLSQVLRPGHMRAH